ncbi:MAG: NRDE family protein [Myxococcota bacterium]|nr:NRDE family protein [Myxococcota bacterium]
MCTLVVLHRCFPDAPLVVAANRDEYLDRPAEGPALRRFGDGRPVVAPRDVRAGGTWLGLAAGGLFAGLTNRPCATPDPRRRSRGLLVADALAQPDAERAAEALARLPEDAYNPFNLLVADGRRCFVAVYEGRARVDELEPGPHVVGNTDPDRRDHPKVSRILRAAEKVAAGSSARAPAALAALCRRHDGRTGPLDDVCIHAGGYGTRSSTLLRRGLSRDADLLRFAEGPPCENGYEDRTTLLRELDREAGDDARA